ncbi:class I adenylate-forming enzyme family protein [Pseudofrankia asymbiotica]|uniref:AMP-dependent synthetase n=1 Tax=Pseudofrankia asymbiotica TaxID=1834516 RepID=A0A1V2IK17_9ACTN|nr:class I adenylate-forming enzyme family protein [Pseudofrankia asymbiotica]ONH33375.1 AMP-dependent synthetase [Pseudofrankia asymbiotica]
MTIAMLLDMARGAYGERIALGSRSGGGLSYEELGARVATGAAAIKASGAERVAFIGVNGPAFPVVLFAAASAGVPIAPLNYRLSAEQLRGQIAQLGAVLVIADEAYRGAVDGVQGAAGIVTTEEWFVATATPAPGADPFADLDPPDVDPDATGVLLFTSGTTSAPKRVILRHSNLISYVLQTVEFASAEEDDAILVSVPPYHVAGVGTVLTNIYSGRRICYLPNFEAQAWLDTVRTERITNVMLVPTMLVRIVEVLGGKPAEAPHLRSLAYGGARMPGQVLEAALAAFPDTGFVNAYGLTETSSTIAVLGPDDHRDAFASDDAAVRARLSSAGRPVPGVEFQIRDEAGKPAGVGEPGLLWVRGEQVSGEYEGLGSVLDEEGWFPTKDGAYLDADGYVFITGRSDDTIIRGGENIAPAEIEDVLGRHPKLRDVAVFGAPDDTWGQRIVAAVVLLPDETATADELRDYVRARLRGSRTPDEVVFVEELPYTPTGKLLRNQVAQLVADRAADEPVGS